MGMGGQAHEDTVCGVEVDGLAVQHPGRPILEASLAQPGDRRLYVQ
jgi:hypothetical protein